MTEHYAYLLNKLSKDVEQFAPETTLSSLSTETTNYVNHGLILIGLIAIIYLIYKL